MIKVEGISKKFKLYRSPADRLREILFQEHYHKDFVALVRDPVKSLLVNYCSDPILPLI
jgi:hypothetical protein